VRTLVTALLMSLLLALPGFGQEKNQFSIFVSDISNWSNTHERTHWYGGVGVAFDRMVTSHLSAQLGVAAEEHRTYPYLVDETGRILPVPPVDIRTYPIDLAARYHWLNDGRWRPYFGAGLRYVAAPHVDQGFLYKNHLNAQLVGGVEFLVRPSFGVVLDAKQLLGDRDNYDALFKLSAGVNWRF
jgi:outer membrane protein W